MPAARPSFSSSFPPSSPWRLAGPLLFTLGLSLLGACSGPGDGPTTGTDQAVSASPSMPDDDATASGGPGAGATAGTQPLAIKAAGGGTGGSTSGAGSAARADCDAFYAARPDFQLDAGHRIDALATTAPPARGTATAEATYGTCLTRFTDHAADFTAADAAFYGRLPTFTRNDYSRRQAFNADGSRVLIYDSAGYWHVYDARTAARVKRLNGPAADAEPHWDPVDPDRLVYLPPSGHGATLHELRVSTNTSTVIGDLKARLAAIWPGADQAFTGAEGSPSRDGRYWCLKVRANGAGTYRSLGLVTWDRSTDRIVGSVSLNGEDPDAVSMSPSGDYCVMQVAEAPGQTRRTVAFSRDFSSSRTLQAHVEHADLAVGADGHDVYVSIDYDSNDGPIFMIDLATGKRTNLVSTYLGGTYTAMHFSGKAYDRPGWVLVSTYADGGGDRKWLHRKVFALKLDASAEIRNLAFHHSAYNGYWTEPHASVNRDFTRVIFNSNWDSGRADDVDAYLLSLPAGMLARPGRDADAAPPVRADDAPAVPSTPPSAPGTAPGTAPGGQPLTVALAASSLSGYDARFSLTSSRPAHCRMASGSGHDHAALYDDITRGADGLSHAKAFTVGAPVATTVYAVCRADDDGAETEVTIALTPAAADPFGVSVTSATMSGYDASFVLSTNEAAHCRMAGTSGHPFDALVEPVVRSDDGRTHRRSLVLGLPTATTVYAVCRADASGREREVAIPLAPATPPATPPTAPDGETLSITLRSASRDGYAGRYTITTSLPARCRAASGPGHDYAVLYDNLTRSSDGKTHSKQLTLGSPAATTVYAVCRAVSSASVQTEIAIGLP